MCHTCSPTSKRTVGIRLEVFSKRSMSRQEVIVKLALDRHSCDQFYRFNFRESKGEAFVTQLWFIPVVINMFRLPDWLNRDNLVGGRLKLFQT